jgi:hypothetical protein
MASMPIYQVSKGPFRILDDKFGTGNFAAAMTNVLQGADGGPALGSGAAKDTLQARTNLQVAANHVTNAQKNHFDNDWLATWWPGLAVADTLRMGMQQAIECAQAANLPMEFFWVCVGGQPTFQVYYAQGDRQVTVLVLTPPPPANYNAGPLVAAEDLWVVKEQDASDTQYLTVNGTLPGTVPAPTPLGPTTNPPPGQIIKQQIWHS